MKASIAAVTVLAALALAAPASAETVTYRGKTTQGKKASAQVVDGRLKLVKLSWSVPCQKKGVRFTNSTKWTDTAQGPIEQPGDGTFTDSGPRQGDIGGGLTAKGTESLSGSFDGQHVAGKTTIKVKIYKGSKQIDTCKGTIRFDIPRV